MDKFNVGDKVICFIHGKGIVVSTDDSYDLPIKVEFTDNDCIDNYTSTGKYLEYHYLPTLYLENDSIFEKV